tara:strand:- start:1105 stop:1554 length:450 start_codon:yes stop_codon:yes gene_type:complete
MNNIPQNIKTGFNNVQDNDISTDNIVALLTHFMDKALTSAEIYTKHSNKNNITVEHIKRSMMLEMFLYNKRINKIEEINKIKDEIKKLENDSDTEDDYIEDDYTEDDTFEENNCNCAICKCINTIYNRWDNFQPTSRLEIIMKKHIDSM